jgi:phosphoglucosamine mutase
VKLFGTDGIRGEAGKAPLDAGTVARVGAALARVSGSGRAARAHRPRYTRVGGPELEAALTRGIASEGGSAS